ncbi:putative capsid polyprotein, partial [Macrobrachium rosenbergii dicistrovirus 2]
ASTTTKYNSANPTPATGEDVTGRFAMNKENPENTNLSEEYSQLVDEQQILSFHDEGKVDVNTEVVSLSSKPEEVLLAATKERRTHDLIDFLERPQVVARILWSTSNVRGTVLSSFSFPKTLFDLPRFSEKIRGFHGMRAGVKVELKVNSQPFQSGGLLLSFLPNAKYNTAKDALHSALEGLVSKTGAPNATINLETSTGCTLEVPYESSFTYLNLNTGRGDIGKFYITVLAPLRDVAAGGTVGIEVFASFTNVDLQFPSSTPIATFQSANIRTLNFKQRALPNMSIADMSDNTHVIGTSRNNDIVPLNTGRVSNDEMSFDNICSIPCLYKWNTFSKTTAVNTKVMSIPVGPYDFPGADQTGVVTPDYLAYVSAPFAKWRGNLVYHFTVYKTKYHSVRLRVLFSPGSVATIDPGQVYSKVVDLREQNSFVFEVPYMHVNSFANSDETLGNIEVWMENSMVAPTTVSDTVDLLVFRSGKSMQYAVPKVCNVFPFRRSVVTMRADAKYDTNETVKDADLKINNFRPEISKWLDANAEKIDAATAAILSLAKDAEPKFRVTKNLLEMKPDQLPPKLFDILSSVGILVTLSKLHTTIKQRSFQSASSSSATTLVRHKPHFESYVQSSKAVRGFSLLTRFFQLVAGFLKKDLTKEGIEPNPGPYFEHFSFSTTPVSINSPYFGKQTINIYFIANSGNRIWMNIDDVPVGSVGINHAPVYAPYQVSYVYEGYEYPKLTFTSGSTVVWANVMFEQPTNDTRSIRFQSSNETTFNDRLTQPVICKSATKFCMPNRIDNVRQMISRSTFFAHLESDGRTIGLNSHIIGTSVSILGANRFFAVDNLTYFASMYTFARGGVNFRCDSGASRYKVFLDPNGDMPMTQPIGPMFEEIALKPGDAFAYGNTMQQLVNTDVEGFGEFEIPYYSTNYAYNIDNRTSHDYPNAMKDQSLPSTLAYIVPADSMNSVLLYRNATKDFQLSYLSGPPLAISGSFV